MTAKINAGSRILDGLRDAISGNFAAVDINGQRWVRADLTKDEAQATISRLTAERDGAERELQEIGWHLRDHYGISAIATKDEIIAGIEAAIRAATPTESDAVR